VTELAATTDDDVRLHVRTDGPDHGTPLLLCNSLGTDLHLWDPQIDDWATHRQVIRFDQRGHGRSDAPPGPYTYNRLTRDAGTVLATIEVGCVDVCGISLGGAIALQLAAHQHDRVGRLVVADTAARIGDQDSWRTRAALVRTDGMSAVADLVVERFFSPGFRAQQPATVEQTRQTLLTLDPEGYAATCEALATGDLCDDVHRITAPTLVVVGADDEATPPADARALHQRLSTSHLCELDGAGHLANLERPDEFGRAVHDVLTAPPATPGDTP
jgi:3-oxoadipate enol-lactonase